MSEKFQTFFYLTLFLLTIKILVIIKGGIQMKCLYCNKDTQKDYCSQECQQKAEQYYQKQRKGMPVFAVVALIAVGVALLWNHPYRTTISLILLGLDFIVFPFTKASTIRRSGIQKSITIARIIGGIALLSGIISYFFI